MKEDIVFKIGDAVTWSSQAGGVARIKNGRVIAVIPPNVHPFRMRGDHYVLPDGQQIPYSRTNYGGGLSRRGVSYVVEVDGGKAYYWPLAGKLQRREDGKYVLRHFINGFLQDDRYFTQDINEAKIMSLDEAVSKCRSNNQESSETCWEVFEAVVGLKLGSRIDT